MSDFLEIAASLHTNSLTFFVGTGFSKYITNGAAPNWLELLIECAESIDKDDILLNQLFNINKSGEIIDCKFELTICAQILEIEFKKKKKNIKEKIVEIINSRINETTIDDTKLNEIQDFFSKYPNVNIITTNYDTLFSDFVLPLSSRVIIEGTTIQRINSGQNIYHIHGCTNKPSSIVLTLNDYYNFQNSNNYFSRKFYTLLQETTVAILGYSLGDFNLNTIFSEVKNTKTGSFRKTEIFYISNNNVPNLLSDFYNFTYGIRVLEDLTIKTFFRSIESHYDKAKDLIESVKDLEDVIAGKSTYNDDYLKLYFSLSQILVQASTLGIEKSDENFLNTIISILNKKVEFCQEDNAWAQYEHLADWLIDIASIIIIKETVIEAEFCTIAKFSFKKCSKDNYLGYSWYAYRNWNNRWKEMKIENQLMLKDIVKNNTWSHFQEIEKIYK